MEKEQPKIKILMFPWLAHGHTFPFLELARRLLRRNFIIYTYNSSYDDIFIKLVELHIPSLVELLPHFHTTQNLPSNLLPTLLKEFQMSSSSFSDILSSINPDLLIYDICREVEEKYIDSLSVLYKKRVVTTCPLIVDSSDYDHEEFSKIMKWLSPKSRYSMVYISFGKEYVLSKEQIVKIAKTLKLCEVNFIWAIRFPGDEKMTSVENAFLIEFLERVNERGLIVQGYYGWSSITEGIYFGIPIIAMPIKSEQLINALLVVEVGVGVEVGREGDELYVRERIAKAINKVIVEMEFCEDITNRAKKLSEKIKEKEEQEVNEAAMELLKTCMKNK
ncbi:hypothetical protein CDL12_19852 [Handroanthus impetiginosus]|uniref:Uncharacterized protein n=1 Tax=Handroanthus impetiginosus TaxID=429701 RepID=A0A2G9GQK4_9LAMI|nr:hypothetical protein CDL12_19852 [Handroanthus impetiginosus]